MTGEVTVEITNGPQSIDALVVKSVVMVEYVEPLVECMYVGSTEILIKNQLLEVTING